HDLFHFGQHFAVFAAQAHAFMIRVAGTAPEPIGSKRRKPNHFEVGILQADADVVRAHAETHADAAVHFDAVRELAAGDHVVDMTLGEGSRRGADVPMVFEGDGAHAALGSLDGDLNHVLGAMDEIGKSVNMAIDGAVEQLVFD